jgi:hypothetical protein
MYQSAFRFLLLPDHTTGNEFQLVTYLSEIALDQIEIEALLEIGTPQKTNRAVEGPCQQA